MDTILLPAVTETTLQSEFPQDHGYLDDDLLVPELKEIRYRTTLDLMYAALRGETEIPMRALLDMTDVVYKMSPSQLRNIEDPFKSYLSALLEQ